MDWNLSVFILCTLLVSLGSLLQAVTGLGAGLIVVPMLASISFTLVPGPLILASLSLSTLMAFQGRSNIDFSNFSPLLCGLSIGTVIAALLIVRLPLSQLGIVFGLLILLAVTISLKSPQVKLTKNAFLAAGILSGFMGTAAGIGAPVLALIYQHHKGASLRPTLAFLYLFSSVIMLIALHIAGRFSSTELISGLYLIPGFLLGYVVSPRLVDYIDRGYARPAVLIISSLSAILLIVRSLSTTV